MTMKETVTAIKKIEDIEFIITGYPEMFLGYDQETLSDKFIEPIITEIGFYDEEDNYVSILEHINEEEFSNIKQTSFEALNEEYYSRL